LVEGNNVYATFNPNSVDTTSGNPPVPGIMILDVATGSIKWQKIITTPRADDPYSDSITALLVHDGMLYITRSKYVYNSQTMAGTIYQTTAMHPGEKTLWQINLGGYNDSEALVP
ncbi:MAG TPA: hypothetical protein VKR42_10640, partial [Ktedonobacteraceae bacterium]|nr:hypothetical protein [Ktedonobacteraceae bacterium]